MTTVIGERVARDEGDVVDPGSGNHLIGAWRKEAAGMIALAPGPDAWEAPAGSRGWQVRDIIGHLVDTTARSFVSFDAARRRCPAPALLGWRDIARQADESAIAF